MGLIFQWVYSLLKPVMTSTSWKQMHFFLFTNFSYIDHAFLFITVCWRPWFVLATIVQRPGVAVLLLPLFLRQWCCAHWSNVRRIPVSGEGPGHTLALCRHGSLVPLEPHGRHHPLRDRFGSCVLRCRVRPVGSVVGLRFCYLRRKHHHLAGSGRLLVEDDRSVVSGGGAVKLGGSFRLFFCCFGRFWREGKLFPNSLSTRFVVDMIATQFF